MGLDVLALIAVLVILSGSAYYVVRNKKSQALESRERGRLVKGEAPVPAKELPLEDASLSDGEKRSSDSPGSKEPIDDVEDGKVPDTIEEISKSTEPETTQELLSEETEQSIELALDNTKKSFWGRIQNLFGADEAPDLDSIEEILYTSDLGPKTVEFLMAKLESDLSKEDLHDENIVRNKIKSEISNMLSAVQGEDEGQLAGLEYELLDDNDETLKPIVWMVVGVNGSGKTTSIGKLANLLSQNGKKVILAAGDTFRAAADAQLKAWSERAGVELFSPENVKDPSAVAFDACKSAVAKGFDHVIVDTAGRLHTQSNLMEELKKMKRVVEKAIPGSPHETLLVVDGNNGQNALIQAKEFHQAVDLTGVILTKMDGSAKGGVVVGVAHELQLPIKRIGIGEKIEDLRVFNTKEFVDAII